MKFTTRKLLAAVGFTALAIGSLRAGGLLAWLTIALISFAVVAMAITLCVATRAKRAFSIGFLIPFVVYGSLHYFSNHDESNIHDSKLPTTQMLKMLHDAIGTREYYDRDSGERLPSFDPDAPRSVGRRVSWHDIPEKRPFAILGHLLMATLLGVAGGFFALLIRENSDGG